MVSFFLQLHDCVLTIVTVQLEREAQAVELAGVSKRDELQERDVWEIMNEKRGEILYAGEFEQ